ncbi:MAG: glycine cleavage system protein GcvH [Thermoplasmatota archaeon]
MPEIPEELRYTEDHEWVKLTDGEAQYGITDYAQEELGDIVYIELPEVGEDVEKGDMIGVIESVKTVSDLYAPMTGTITKVNDELEESPETINDDPYGDGWIVKIEYEDKSEYESLMDAEKFKLHTE